MKFLSFLVCCALAALLLVSPAHAQNKNMVSSIDQPALGQQICLGNSIIPKATVWNVSSGTSARAQLLIHNAATGTKVYGDTVDVIGIAAGTSSVVTFDAFVSNLNIPAHSGRMNVTVIGTTLTNGVVTPDSEPSDDTMRTTMYVVRRLTRPFIDASNEYLTIGSMAVPDPNKWVTQGATVVEGDLATFDPPSPRDPGTGYGKLKLHSPVIKLDRLSYAPLDHSNENAGGNTAGDTMTSFPINLQNVTNASISFDYHRSSKQLYPWLYDKEKMIGAEAAILNSSGTISRPGDSLIIEFKKPTEDGCNPSVTGWTQVAAIDGGKDFEFQRFTLPIESKNKPGLNYFTLDFRFRIRLKAKNDVPFNATGKDDEDPWYIDNIRLESPSSGRETQVNWVRVVSPFSKVPASQAIVPVYVKLTNIASTDKTPIPLVVQIDGPDSKPKYFQRMDVPRPTLGKDTIIRFPNYDATNTLITLGNELKVKAFIPYSNYDLFEGDNSAYSSFFLNAESEGSLTHEFAYDDGGILPTMHSGNDWPTVTTRTGQGVGFNNSSGAYAMRIKLMKRDTLYGIRAYFGRANASPDALRFAVYEGSDSSNVPGAMVSIQGISTSFQSERRGDAFDKFWPYYFPKPVVLHGVTDSTDGVYWVSIGQRSLDNMALGADISRSGMDMRIKDSANNNVRMIHSSKYATQFSATQNAGNIANAFAFQITDSIGAWQPLHPKYMDGEPFAWTGATLHYIPMIRALFGRQTLLPVEFAKPLTASAQENAALLTWTTVTESNNSGFIVQRLASDDDWQRIGFVRSRSTNSNTPSGYAFVDEGLSAGTYTYRLTQVDLDGTQSISNIAQVSIDGTGARISNFTPNPFNPSTGVATLSIDPSLGEVSVAIFNALGQQVRTITASGVIIWDGKDDAGKVVASGAYLVQLPNGETRRITIVR
jgi:hypothetical protein